MSTLFLSVIVPVYNDSARLQLCLESLEKQTLSKEKYEIIVIDNNSVDNVADVVNGFPQAVLACENKIGSYAARNKGISLAKGNAFAFTDSDCIPAEDWLEKGIWHLQQTPNCGFIAGDIRLFFQRSDRPNPIELYDSLFNLQQKKYLEEQGWGATANLFAFKSVFEQVGDFNIRLQSGGDAEWGKRVSAAGYQVFYAEDCYIHHPARALFGQFCQKNRRTLIGAYRLSQTSTHDHILQSFVFEDSLLTQLRPPLRSAFRKSYQDGRLNRGSHKITVFLLVVFFHYLRAFEILRLKFIDFKASSFRARPS
mgnify:CR=1 FL=1